MTRRNDRARSRPHSLTRGQRDALLFAAAAACQRSPTESELRSIVDFAQTARAGESILLMLLEGKSYPAGLKQNELGVRAITDELTGSVKLFKDLQTIKMKKAKVDVATAIRSKVAAQTYLSPEEVKRLTLVHEFAARQCVLLEVDLETFLDFAGNYRREQLMVQAVLSGNALPLVDSSGTVQVIAVAERMDSTAQRRHRRTVLALKSGNGTL